jgi:chromosome segregation ATPase
MNDDHKNPVTLGQVLQITQATHKRIDDLTDILATQAAQNVETTKAITQTNVAVAETAKQVKHTNEQLARYEERAFSMQKDVKRIEDKVDAQGEQITTLRDQQTHDTMFRKAGVWLVGIIVAGVVGGAIAFAWKIADKVVDQAITVGAEVEKRKQDRGKP